MFIVVGRFYERLISSIARSPRTTTTYTVDQLPHPHLCRHVTHQGVINTFYNDCMNEMRPVRKMFKTAHIIYLPGSRSHHTHTQIHTQKNREKEKKKRGVSLNEIFSLWLCVSARKGIYCRTCGSRTPPTRTPVKRWWNVLPNPVGILKDRRCCRWPRHTTLK